MPVTTSSRSSGWRRSRQVLIVDEGEMPSPQRARKVSLQTKSPVARSHSQKLSPESSTTKRSRASLRVRRSVASRRWRRPAASRSSLCSAGTRRARLSFRTKSTAPCRINAAARSSPTAPETTRTGMSNRRLVTSANTSDAVNPANWWSVRIASNIPSETSWPISWMSSETIGTKSKSECLSWRSSKSRSLGLSSTTSSLTGLFIRQV